MAGCRTLLGHDDSVYDVRWAPDATAVGSASRDGTVAVWDAATGERITTWTTGGPASCIGFSPDGTLLIAGGHSAAGNGWVKAYRLADGAQVVDWPLAARVEAVLAYGDGLVVGEGSGHVHYRPQITSLIGPSWDVGSYIFSVAEAARPGMLVVGAQGSVAFLEVTGPTRVAATLTVGDSVDVLDCIAAPSSSPHPSLYAASLRMHDQGSIGTSEHPDLFEILLWDPETDPQPRLDESLIGHAAWIGCLAFSPDGRLLASSSFDGSARIWDTDAGVEVASLHGHQGAVYATRFSPVRGDRVATACADGTVRLWDLPRVGAGRNKVRLDADDGVQWQPGPGRDGFLTRALFTADLLLSVDGQSELDKLVHDALPFSDIPPNRAVVQVLNIRAEQARREGDDATVTRCRRVQHAVVDHSNRMALGLSGLRPPRAASAVPQDDLPAEDGAGAPAEAAEVLQQLEQMGRTYEAVVAGTGPVEPVIELATGLLDRLPKEELPEIVASVLDTLGSALCVSGDNEAGREVLRQAEELCRSLPEGSADDVTASVLQHYGNALVNTGHLVQAATVLAEAVSVARQVGGVAYIEALGNLAVGASAIGDTETQRRSLHQAIDVARIVGMRPQLAALLDNLGGLNKELGDLEAAVQAYAEATAIAQELGDRRGETISLGNAAAARRRLGDVDGALSGYASAYAVAADLGDVNTVVYCLVGAAETLADSDPARAESLLREAVDLSAPARPTRRWSALMELAALVAPRDPADALALLGDAVALGEQVRRSATTPDQVPRWQERLATAYGDMADLLLRHGDAEGAFDQVEKAKAALFVRSLGASGDTETRPVDRIRQALAAAGTSAVLVSYHLHGRTLTAYVLRADDGVLRVERSTLTPADLAGAVADAERDLGRPPRARPVETWTRLATALIDPVLPHLRDGDVVLFSPHGPLHRIPLHALPAGGRRVIERWPVAYLPSGSALPALLQRAARPTARRCVVGAHFVDEAQEVERILAADTLTAGGDGGATKQDMLGALDAYDVVHVSAHGYHVPRRPRASGLLLKDSSAVRRYLRLVQAPLHTLSPADRQQLPELRDLVEGSLLTAWDVEQTRVAARLVSLSACSTGLAYVDESDDPIGLVPALLRAGSAGVLATLWLVDAGSARRLCTGFYRQMLAAPGGWGVAARALRCATLDEMAQNAHPYYWAAFVLVGGVAPGDAAPWEDQQC